MMYITQIVCLFLLLIRSHSFQEDDAKSKLQFTFDHLAKIYIADSASLHRFYFKWPSPRDVQKDIDRMNGLLQDSVQKQYQAVYLNLKPLLTRISIRKRLNRMEAQSLVTLYSAYDHFRGEAMCAQVLTDRDNYDLVWKSFDVLVSASKKDTFYMAALMSLSESIKTNAELGEAMPGFVWESIRNNPEGFLKMFSRREKSNRVQWMNPWTWEGLPDQSLKQVFDRISRSPGHPKLSEAAKELLKQIDESQ